MSRPNDPAGVDRASVQFSTFQTNLKGLFRQLVSVAGGIDAAGMCLGVSHQRVSQLYSLKCADLPKWEHVLDLEAFCGQSVVFGALARMAEQDDPTAKDALQEACEVTEAAAELLRLARSGAPAKDIELAALAVQREAMDVPRARLRTV